jgi:hypothetical protein
MIGEAVACAREQGAELLFHIFCAILRDAAMNKTFMELIGGDSGHGNRYPGQLWHALGWVSIIYYAMLGMEYDESGLRFDHPCVPEPLKDMMISNFRYREGVFDIQVKGFGSLRQDLVLFSERDLEPYYDFSLAWMGAYDIAGEGIVTLGGGISLEHLLPVDEELTTPEREYQNLYIENPDTPADDATVVGDSGYYTFWSTKVMGRLSFDPKRMWRDDDAQDNGILGTEDLKLYAEGAALGLKDYPANESQNNPGYEDIMERVPVMVGFNVPAFRVLDVLSVEVQWFGSRAPNSYNRVMFSTTLPQAASGSTPASTRRFHA